MPPKKKQPNIKIFNAMRSSQLNDNNNDESVENGSLNQEGSTIINNQTNQNLQNSAVSAAALPLLQQINCLP